MDTETKTSKTLLEEQKLKLEILELEKKWWHPYLVYLFFG